ncbi:MAG TPA: TetR family transcriptional regulator [Solirubrobacteraceae bacterium]|jgi:AcrR family transcriptional regulator|nr:TetR family transcriptional regulator [Solirubrobacteraceae bacterium]
MASIEDTRTIARAGRDGAPRGHVSEIQRARMLSAAIEAIEHNGYERLTVAEVIGRAKVSRKTFYDLFEDREDCFLAVFEATLAQLSARAVPPYREAASWRAGVRAGLAALLAFVEDEPELARLCIVDALGGGPRVLAVRARALAELQRTVDLGRGEQATKSPPPSVTAEGVVGAVLAVLHTRLLERSPKPYLELHGPLMSMIVLPYLGARVAARELGRSAPTVSRKPTAEQPVARDPMAGLDMRLTYRTVRVLSAIAERPRASNREVAEGAGIADQGQISKLLARLQGLGLIENVDRSLAKGAPNEWQLTERGERVERATKPM